MKGMHEYGWKDEHCVKYGSVVSGALEKVTVMERDQEVRLANLVQILVRGDPGDDLIEELDESRKIAFCISSLSDFTKCRPIDHKETRNRELEGNLDALVACATRSAKIVCMAKKMRKLKADYHGGKKLDVCLAAYCELEQLIASQCLSPKVADAFDTFHRTYPIEDFAHKKNAEVTKNLNATRGRACSCNKYFPMTPPPFFRILFFLHP